MKALIAFAALVTTVWAVPATELISEEDVESSEIDASSSSEISYYFYTRQDPNTGLKISSPSDVDVLTSVKGSLIFDNEKDTAIFIHGWQDTNESDFNYNLRVAALAVYDVNVFVVDWSVMSLENYLTARYAVVRLGEAVAAFVQALVDNFGLDLDRVTIAGHSLGAQIAGNAGAALNGQVGHIVGLDPALPLFNNYYSGDRLDATDAQFVQIIHTNAGLAGFKASIGHADYFPNGGETQKGCESDAACSHCRAWEFYADSLSSDKFVAKSCASYAQFTKGSCDSNKSAYMGGLYPDYSAEGDYYLDTAEQSPFALS